MSKHKAIKELEGEILRETENAIQFKFEDDEGIERTEWFPVSQTDNITYSEPVVLTVSQWIYDRKAETWK